MLFRRVETDLVKTDAARNWESVEDIWDWLEISSKAIL